MSSGPESRVAAAVAVEETEGTAVVAVEVAEAPATKRSASIGLTYLYSSIRLFV